MKKKAVIVALLAAIGCSSGGRDLSKVTFPYGVIEMGLKCKEVGQRTPVEMHFSEPVPYGMLWVICDNNNGLYELGEYYIREDRKMIKIILIDGGDGDLINKPDGMIFSNGGPAIEVKEGEND